MSGSVDFNDGWHEGQKALLDVLRKRVMSFGGFDRPTAFWIKREDVLSAIDECEPERKTAP